MHCILAKPLPYFDLIWYSTVQCTSTVETMNIIIAHKLDSVSKTENKEKNQELVLVKVFWKFGFEVGAIW
jgi:hypothetical protein